MRVPKNDKLEDSELFLPRGDHMYINASTSHPRLPFLPIRRLRKGFDRFVSPLRCVGSCLDGSRSREHCLLGFPKALVLSRSEKAEIQFESQGYEAVVADEDQLNLLLHQDPALRLGKSWNDVLRAAFDGDTGIAMDFPLPGD